MSNNLLSPELNTLIEEYLGHFLKVRELYMKIEQKATREEGFTEDSIGRLLYDKFQETIKQQKSSSTSNNNNDNNNNILYSHFQ